MITRPNAKINIGLFITGKRSDGFHTMESVFYPIPLSDELQIKEASEFSFLVGGIAIPGAENDNLCQRAYRLLKQDFSLPPVEISLSKSIPIGAGLGGGSADGAFTLKMLNHLFQLNLNDPKLENYAGRLGSDCPFFVRNKPQFVTGRGEVLEPLELSLKGLYLVLVKPPVFISTKQAYTGIVPKQAHFDLRELSYLPIAEWKNNVFNDFEYQLLARYPQVAEAKRQLYAEGAVYASMTGSGSSVYGIFDGTPKTGGFSMHGDCWQFHLD